VCFNPRDENQEVIPEGNVFTSRQFRSYFFFDKKIMTGISEEKLA
jgi:hypothetical protein